MAANLGPNMPPPPPFAAKLGGGAGGGAGTAPSAPHPPLYRVPSEGSRNLCECPICFQPMTDSPVSLFCGHTACKGCLVQLFKNSRACMICAAIVPEEQRREANLKVNITIKDLAQRQYRQLSSAEVNSQKLGGDGSGRPANDDDDISMCTTGCSDIFTCSFCCSANARGGAGCTAQVRVQSLEPHYDLPWMNLLIFIMTCVALAGSWTRGTMENSSIFAYKLSYDFAIGAPTSTVTSMNYDGVVADDDLQLYTGCLEPFCETCHVSGSVSSWFLVFTLLLHMVSSVCYLGFIFPEGKDPPVPVTPLVWSRLLPAKVIVYGLTVLFAVIVLGTYAQCHDSIYKAYSYTSFSHGNGWNSTLGILIVSVIAFVINTIILIRPSLCDPSPENEDAAYNYRAQV